MWNLVFAGRRLVAHPSLDSVLPPPRPIYLAVAVAIGLLAFAARPAAVFAGGVVGTGTSGSCTEAALKAAVAGGGTVTFNCGSSATITLTNDVVVAKDTVIDGGGRITISGNNVTRVFQTNNYVKFTVQNLTIVNGKEP